MDTYIQQIRMQEDPTHGSPTEDNLSLPFHLHPAPEKRAYFVTPRRILLHAAKVLELG
jgi:hypothetical protein